jgi:CHASE3 domain sensor protein
VLLLSATVAVLLGTALGLLIVTVAGQRGAAREALRSQEALTTASLLQGSLVRIENGVRGFAASGRAHRVT